MGHSHSHNHSHHHDLNSRNLLISIFLNIAITVAQVIGGIVSGSLALLSDALHNFSDVISLIISWIANKLVKKKASLKRTFGYKRAEILAAFINAATLIVVAVLLIFEAIERFRNPQEIESNLVIWLSIIAILGNGFSVLLLKKNADNNMNLKSAYLHLLTDMLASVAVLIGGLLMKYYEIWWIDSVLTLAIAVYLVVMGWDLLKNSFKVLMLFTPDSTSVKSIVEDIQTIDAVKNVHHVHIWQLNEEEIPNTIIADNTGGILMQRGEVDMCIVGTDRTLSNGDVCNKIGTYLKALAAHDNNIPFYVTLPSSTIDWDIKNAQDIPIEERNSEELSHVEGIDENNEIKKVLIYPKKSKAMNLAFDITPAKYVTGLITEKGTCEASPEGLKKLFK